MSRVRPAVVQTSGARGVPARDAGVPCSQVEPTPKDFVTLIRRPAKAEEAGITLEKAELTCKAETEKKGMASVVAIFSCFRKGSADEDYIACMKAHGFEVKP